MAARDLTEPEKFADPPSEQQIDLGIDWSLTDPEVSKWIREHSSELITNITGTTKARIRAELQNGYLLGDSRDHLAERVRKVMQDVPEWRAKLIAQTEIITAHTQGQESAWRSSPWVRGKRWVDGQPNACPTCQALNGQIVDVQKGEFDIGHGPPAHPGCRCTIAPTLTLPRGRRKPTGVKPDLPKLKPISTTPFPKENFRNLGDVNAWMNNKYPNSNTLFKNLDPQMASRIARELDALMAKYPEVIDSIRGIRDWVGQDVLGQLSNNVYARVNYSSELRKILIDGRIQNVWMTTSILEINPNLVNNSKFFSMYMNDIRQGFHTNLGVTQEQLINNLITHEFGHIIDKKLSQMPSSYLLNNLKSQLSDKQIARLISGYAMTNDAEAFAELFTYVDSGTKIPIMSARVYGEMLKEVINKSLKRVVIP